MILQCLSIRQPWAHLIIAGHKNVENRTWPTPLRGTIAVHASGTATKQTYEAAKEFIEQREIDVKLPPIEDLQTKAIIGLVDIAGCVTESDSRWFTGPYGYVLSNPRRGPIKPLKGQQGFFHASYYHFGNCGCGGAVLRPGLDGYACEFCGSIRTCLKCGMKLSSAEFFCAACNREMAKVLR